MKIMYFAEIGLNYLGKPDLLKKYLNYLSLSDVDGVTIQILKDSFYKDYFKNYKISKLLLSTFVEKLKKNNKLVGIVTNDLTKINQFKKMKIDFFKVLSSNICEIDLIKSLLKTNCKNVYLSTGMVNYNEINNVLKKIKIKKDKLSLIHTSFKKNKNYLNLKRIDILKSKFKIPVCYGNHSKYLRSLIDVKKYQPNAIFFYVKLNKKLNYPDNIHAIKLKNIKKYIY